MRSRTHGVSTRRVSTFLLHAWYHFPSLPSACKRHCYPERGALSSQKYVPASCYVCTCSSQSSRMGFLNSAANPQCKRRIQPTLRPEWLRNRGRWNQSPPNRPYRRRTHPHAQSVFAMPTLFFTNNSSVPLIAINVAVILYELAWG
jgi:hypothetical protein